MRAAIDAAGAANAAWWRFDLIGGSATVKRLGPGDRHDPHVDSTANPITRKLSVVAMLSDPGEYDGGTLTLDVGQPHAIRLGRGDLIVLPSWTNHRVTPIERGERTTLVAHAYGPPFR